MHVVPNKKADYMTGVVQRAVLGSGQHALTRKNNLRHNANISVSNAYCVKKQSTYLKQVTCQ